MLTISIEFLHGTVRASSADDLALAGQGATAEWPPSPARLYAALVAGGGTGERCRLPGGEAGLALLEGAPPVIHAEATPVATPLQPRFAVIDETAEGTVQNYPGRKAQTVRPGVRLALRNPIVRFVWPDVVPTPVEADALRTRAARVGYFGCADSPVRVVVATEAHPDPGPLDVWEPAEDGGVVVAVPYPGFRDRLDDAFEAWTDGRPHRRAWIPNRLVHYRAPGDRAHRERPRAVWLRFDAALDARKVLAVTQTLRSAVLERVDRLVGGPDRVPALLHGHATERGSEHAQWLALAHAGGRHADGRIRGACVRLPADSDPEVVDLVRVATASIDRLVAPGRFDVGTWLFDGATNPWTSNPARWTGPARRWVSVFPAVQERWTKRGPGIGEVARWCAHAGLPEPVSARLSNVPLVRGAAALSPIYVFRAGEERRPFGHLEVTFAEPVDGPFALGRGRHFGIGLMAPADRDEERSRG